MPNLKSKNTTKDIKCQTKGRLKRLYLNSHTIGILAENQKID